MENPIVPIPKGSSEQRGGGTILTGKASSISGEMRYERPYALFKPDLTTFTTIASGMATTVPWGGVGALNLNVDPLGMWGGLSIPGTTNVKMIAPVRGLYQFAWSCGWDAAANNAVGTRKSELWAQSLGNALALIDFDLMQAVTQAPANPATTPQHLTTTVAMDIGEFAEVIVTQTSGGNAAFHTYAPFCSMLFLGPL